MLGLPDGVTACLFDLDGVLTQTAKVHNAAWKETFDAYLRGRAERTGEPFRPFDSGDDYNKYVDGRPRADGVRTFLGSRGITLPEGSPDDPPDVETVNGIGNRKNELLLRHIREDGVETYEGSVAYLKVVRESGLRRAVVSASANCRDILTVTGLIDEVEVVVDGIVARRDNLRGKPHPDTFLDAAKLLGVARRDNLRGKPHPDTFLDAAKLLGVAPSAAAVFEDALAGVEAGSAGDFGLVVGVDRVGQTDALYKHGAHVVVRDLSELLENP